VEEGRNIELKRSITNYGRSPYKIILNFGLYIIE